MPDELKVQLSVDVDDAFKDRLEKGLVSHSERLGISVEVILLSLEQIIAMLKKMLQLDDMWMGGVFDVLRDFFAQNNKKLMRSWMEKKISTKVSIGYGEIEKPQENEGVTITPIADEEL